MKCSKCASAKTACDQLPSNFSDVPRLDKTATQRCAVETNTLLLALYAVVYVDTCQVIPCYVLNACNSMNIAVLSKKDCHQKCMDRSGIKSNCVARQREMAQLPQANKFNRVCTCICVITLCV